MAFSAFPRHHKKWWLAPIIVVFLLVMTLIVLGGTVAAPFIYSLLRTMTSPPRMESRPARKRTPKAVALIDRDRCTGCQACCQVCPVDCITLVRQGAGVMGIDLWCAIDQARCIGCKLCIRAPRRRSESYTLRICPWEAIEMVPTPGAASMDNS